MSTRMLIGLVVICALAILGATDIDAYGAGRTVPAGDVDSLAAAII